MLTIAPGVPAVTQCRANACIIMNEPVTLTANTLSQSCGVISIRRPSGYEAASLTSTSTRPNPSIAAFTAACARPGAATSPVSVTTAGWPAKYPESTRSQTTTDPPASVNACVIARPIPLEPPVTIATCPSNRPTVTRPSSPPHVRQLPHSLTATANIVDCRRNVV